MACNLKITYPYDYRVGAYERERIAGRSPGGALTYINKFCKSRSNCPASSTKARKKKSKASKKKKTSKKKGKCNGSKCDTDDFRRVMKKASVFRKQGKKNPVELAWKWLKKET